MIKDYNSFVTENLEGEYFNESLFDTDKSDAIKKFVELSKIFKGVISKMGITVKGEASGYSFNDKIDVMNIDATTKLISGDCESCSLCIPRSSYTSIDNKIKSYISSLNGVIDTNDDILIPIKLTTDFMDSFFELLTMF